MKMLKKRINKMINNILSSGVFRRFLVIFVVGLLARVVFDIVFSIDMLKDYKEIISLLGCVFLGVSSIFMDEKLALIAGDVVSNGKFYLPSERDLSVYCHNPSSSGNSDSSRSSSRSSRGYGRRTSAALGGLYGGSSSRTSAAVRGLYDNNRSGSVSNREGSVSSRSSRSSRLESVASGTESTSSRQGSSTGLQDYYRNRRVHGRVYGVDGDILNSSVPSLTSSWGSMISGRTDISAIGTYDGFGRLNVQQNRAHLEPSWYYPQSSVPSSNASDHSNRESSHFPYGYWQGNNYIFYRNHDDLRNASQNVDVNGSQNGNSNDSQNGDSDGSQNGDSNE